MGHTNITQEKKLAIAEAYVSGEKTIKDIVITYGLTSSDHLYAILKEQGVSKKRAFTPRALKPTCKHCGHKNPSGAMFCNMCGKSLKTEEEIIIDNLLMARAKALKYVPDTVKSEVDKWLVDAANLLKAKCGISK